MTITTFTGSEIVSDGDPVFDRPLERAREVTDELRSYNKIVIFFATAGSCEKTLASPLGEFLLQNYTPHVIFPKGVSGLLSNKMGNKLSGKKVTEIAVPEERLAIWRQVETIMQSIAAREYEMATATAELDRLTQKMIDKPEGEEDNSQVRSAKNLFETFRSWFPGNLIHHLQSQDEKAKTTHGSQRIELKRLRKRLQSQVKEAKTTHDSQRIELKKLRKQFASKSDAPPALSTFVAVLNEIDPLFGVAATTPDSALFNDFLLAAHEARVPHVLIADEPASSMDSLLLAKPKNVLNISEMPQETVLDTLTSLCQEKLAPVGGKSRLTRENRNRRVMSHAYGADRIMLQYCGLKCEHSIPDYWMHGWIPEYHNEHPEIIALHKLIKAGEGLDERRERIKAEKTTRPQFVSREDQAAYLRENGYTRACAIGLPFVYLPEVSVERKRGSLIVMPPHGRTRHGHGDPVAEAYADYIDSKRDLFSSVHVILTSADYVTREWVGAFEQRGIEVLAGTHHSEHQTLLRQKALLSSAEYVTTNGFGSHIAYAAACGCKVSVAGPFAEWEERQLSRVFAVKTYPHILPAMMRLHSEEGLRQAFPSLFVEPEDSQSCQEWGEKQIGADCIKGPDEIITLFGWQR